MVVQLIQSVKGLGVSNRMQKSGILIMKLTTTLMLTLLLVIMGCDSTNEMSTSSDKPSNSSEKKNNITKQSVDISKYQEFIIGDWGYEYSAERDGVTFEMELVTTYKSDGTEYGVGKTTYLYDDNIASGKFEYIADYEIVGDTIYETVTSIPPNKAEGHFKYAEVIDSIAITSREKIGVKDIGTILKLDDKVLKIQDEEGREIEMYRVN